MPEKMHGAKWDALPDSMAGRLVHWFEWVWNQQDARVIDLLFAEDGLAHGLGGEPMRGPKEFHEFHRTFLAAFAPLHFEIEHAFEAGDHVAIHAHARITDRGAPLTVSGIAIARMRGGQMVEAWNHFDFVPVLVNRGLLSMDDLMSVFAAPPSGG